MDYYAVTLEFVQAGSQQVKSVQANPVQIKPSPGGSNASPSPSINQQSAAAAISHQAVSQSVSQSSASQCSQCKSRCPWLKSEARDLVIKFEQISSCWLDIVMAPIENFG